MTLLQREVRLIGRFLNPIGLRFVPGSKRVWQRLNCRGSAFAFHTGGLPMRGSAFQPTPEDQHMPTDNEINARLPTLILAIRMGCPGLPSYPLQRESVRFAVRQRALGAPAAHNHPSRRRAQRTMRPHLRKGLVKFAPGNTSLAER